MNTVRCQWVSKDPLYIDYHDNEWGIPVYDERLLFEFLMLEGMQAGLSWLTILKKRNAYREAFDYFDAEKIALYSNDKVNALLNNAGIVRNRLKIQAIINNAKAFLELKEKQGSFSTYLWRFVDGEPLKNHWENIAAVPVTTPISDMLACELKQHGFKFVGSTICYAFMQAVGMVDDHTTDCFCYHRRK